MGDIFNTSASPHREIGGREVSDSSSPKIYASFGKEIQPSAREGPDIFPQHSSLLVNIAGVPSPQPKREEQWEGSMPAGLEG